MIDSVTAVSFDPLACQKKQNGPEKKQKKQQLISQMEGNFYCTYVIGETGKKTLISKIPISETEKENICLERSAFENIKNMISHNSKNSEKTTRSKGQVAMENSTSSNRQEMMEILTSAMGIPGRQDVKR